MKAYFELTQEFESDAAAKYDALAGNLDNILKGMRDELQELCDKVQFEPVMKVVNETIYGFYNEIYGSSGQIMREWIEGANSITARAKFYEAGENAINRAQRIDNNIAMRYEEFWYDEPMRDPITCQNEEANITEEDLDTLSEIYIKYSDELAELVEAALNEINNLADEQPTYAYLLEPMEALGGPVSNAFRGFVSKVNDFKTEIQDKANTMSTNSEIAMDTAKNSAENAETLLDAVSMFEGTF